ncbi:unnamed protein product [Pleuronectes platessa]|uniref:Uncharacterized protein n=1 Tax=Pleuronectes platessa TaxID=8262 RepID=A0A9N7UEQ5_PLEPL|nr:unnamed protein product [Pleuronectes platessa]
MLLKVLMELLRCNMLQLCLSTPDVHQLTGDVIEIVQNQGGLEVPIHSLEPEKEPGLSPMVTKACWTSGVWVGVCSGASVETSCGRSRRPSSGRCVTPPTNATRKRRRRTVFPIILISRELIVYFRRTEATNIRSAKSAAKAAARWKARTTLNCARTEKAARSPDSFLLKLHQ